MTHQSNNILIPIVVIVVVVVVVLVVVVLVVVVLVVVVLVVVAIFVVVLFVVVLVVVALVVSFKGNVIEVVLLGVEIMVVCMKKEYTVLPHTVRPRSTLSLHPGKT